MISACTESQKGHRKLCLWCRYFRKRHLVQTFARVSLPLYLAMLSWSSTGISPREPGAFSVGAATSDSSYFAGVVFLTPRNLCLWQPAAAFECIAVWDSPGCLWMVQRVTAEKQETKEARNPKTNVMLGREMGSCVPNTMFSWVKCITEI